MCTVLGVVLLSNGTGSGKINEYWPLAETAENKHKYCPNIKIPQY